MLPSIIRGHASTAGDNGKAGYASAALDGAAPTRGESMSTCSRSNRLVAWLAMLPALAATAAFAQDYPSRPIRYLVPFGAGSIGDITARTVGQKMSESMGQPIIIDNRPSAGLIVASVAAAKAEPDGYTVLHTGNGAALTVSMFNSLPYDIVKDYAHISTLGFFDMAVLGATDTRFSSLADALAHVRANPGKLDIGTLNIGSTQYLAVELFKTMAGIRAQTVPYKTSPAALAALRGGEVQLMFESVGAVIGQVRANTVKALAVTSNRRSPLLPGVPTVAESGVAGYHAASWASLVAPARTPVAIVDRLNREVTAALASPEVVKRLLDVGVEARGSTPRQAHDLMVSEIGKWREVIERAGIPKQ
jgi:tripartite-type tricarboxylate transporter receptor subunit TctC